jgi:response regulator of citrate/malate metabolism
MGACSTPCINSNDFKDLYLEGNTHMSDGLDVIIVDDNKDICEVIAQIINKFYTWGDVFVFSNVNEATIYCLNREPSIAIFIVDVFHTEKSGFLFLDDISEKFPSVYEDTIMITGNACDEVVDMCVASNINHLLEKPVREYVLQLAVKAIVTKYTKFAGRLLNNHNYISEYEKLFQLGGKYQTI